MMARTKFSALSTMALAGALFLSTAASAGADSAKSIKGWAKGAAKAVDHVMEYPRMRVSGSGNGIAIFHVTIDRDGDVVNSEQTRRTWSRALNIAARNVVKKANFPAIPASVGKDQLTFELRLGYGVSDAQLRSRKLREGRVTSQQIAQGDAATMASLRVLPDTAE